MSGSRSFDLPQELLQVLPSDPFEQLDVARKITSIALSTRVSALESESSDLRELVAEKDKEIADLQSHVESLEASLSDAFHKLSIADGEKENLVRENSSLSNTVKRLQRDVLKLEGFRKTLMMSLQDDDQNAGTTQIIAKPTPNDEDSPFQPSKHSSIQSQASEAIESATIDVENEAPKSSLSNSVPLVSQTTTPRLTPPGSPPTLSASTTPKTTSRPISPRRHSVSFSTTRGMFDDNRSSISISEPGSQTGRTRVDGKEFFRQVRSRLSYEQFGAFLGNVKDLNAHKQTRDETLRKAEEIFGSDNRDLFVIFEGLITRNAH
uniref:At4g15545-like C-terminal domain-containing protein n=1 Tax=Arabis nemorensis TaxID=586526 RepID=A0A565BHC8_9BRAS